MNAIVKINEDLEVEVVTDPKHEWLLSTKDVAEGYGLNEAAVRMTKGRHADELVEGKHFIHDVTKRDGVSGGSKTTMWTKRGVARLGFFIKTPMAKEFRDWAEDYIIEGGQKVSTTAIPQTFAQALLLAAQQAQAIELMAPKVNTYDAIMDTSSSFLLGEAGNAVGVKTNKLSKFLCEKKYIFKLGKSKYKPYAKYLEQGLFVVKITPRDEETTSAQLRVTPKGVELLHSLVGEYDAWHMSNYGTTGRKKVV